MVVGDRNIKDTIVNLYTMWTHDNPKHNKNMLWAYKTKLLGFTRYVPAALARDKTLD